MVRISTAEVTPGMTVVTRDRNTMAPVVKTVEAITEPRRHSGLIRVSFTDGTSRDWNHFGSVEVL